MPGDTPFDAALAALDVEAVDRKDSGVTVHEIVGLDDVRAAHRAEVDAAVKAEREACAKVCDERAAMHRSLADALWAALGGGHSPAIARSYDMMSMYRESAALAAEIRARGVARPRTDGEASEQGAKS